MKEYKEGEAQQVIVVLGVILNDNGEILLTKRNEPENTLWHKKWQLPGGGVQWSETTEQALKREIKEETGYNAIIKTSEMAIYLDHWFHSNSHKGTTLLIAFKAYLLENSTDIETILDSETLCMKWFPINEVSKLDLLPGVTFLIEKLFSNHQKS